MRVRLETHGDAENVAASISVAVQQVLDSRRRAGVSGDRVETLAGVLQKVAVSGGAPPAGATAAAVRSAHARTPDGRLT